MDLFKCFCVPAHAPLPELFDESLATSLSPYRRFRHVVFHSYGFQLEWERMREGIEKAEDVFAKFKANLFHYLQNLKSD